MTLPNLNLQCLNVSLGVPSQWVSRNSLHIRVRFRPFTSSDDCTGSHSKLIQSVVINMPVHSGLSGSCANFNRLQVASVYRVSGDDVWGTGAGTLAVAELAAALLSLKDPVPSLTLDHLDQVTHPDQKRFWHKTIFPTTKTH